MKLGFVTCVTLGLSCIEEIYSSGYKLELLVTLKDNIATKKSGRIYLDEFAEKKHIDLLKVKNVNDSEVIQAIKDKNIDWLFIIGWSQIAKKEILDVPKFGVIGMHPTLLPKGRGRASIPWAIIKGLKKTGVTAFKLDEGVDTGAIIDHVEIEISKNETATTLYKKVNESHIVLMKSLLKKIHSENFELKVQNNADATEWSGRKPEDGLITEDMTIEEVDRLVRATTHPYPGAFLTIDGEKIIIWEGKIVNNNSNDKDLLKFSDGFYQMTNFTKEKIY